jgi:hypothetical protein
VEARRVLGVLNRPTATFARTPGQVRYTQSAPSTAPQKGGRRTIKYWYARKRPSVRGHSITTIFLGCSSCNALKFYCRSLCFFWWHLRLYLICIPTLLNNSLLLWYRHVLYEIPPYPTYRMIHILHTA